MWADIRNIIKPKGQTQESSTVLHARG